MKANTGISPLLRKDGQMAVSDVEKVDVLNTFFLCIYKRKYYDYTSCQTA